MYLAFHVLIELFGISTQSLFELWQIAALFPFAKAYFEISACCAPVSLTYDPRLLDWE